MLLNERETLARVLRSVGPPSLEHVPMWEAGNRVLAQDIVAIVALPRFNNSTMDGYAVRAEDARRGARLLVCGERRRADRVERGPRSDPDYRRADPRLADADHAGDVDATSLFFREGVARKISGWRRRSLRRPKSHPKKPLTGPRLAAIASQGKTNYRYGVPGGNIATGSELKPGEQINSGDLEKMDFVACRTGPGRDLLIVPDLRAHLPEFPASAGRRCDMVASPGRIQRSWSQTDVTKAASSSSERAVKPGKPFMFERLETPWSSVCRNPVSAFVTFLLFATSALETGAVRRWVADAVRAWKRTRESRRSTALF
jgi:molybdopterin molybdotransferase